MTVTVSLFSDHATSKHHTGLLALGWRKNDHQPVFDHFMDEISNLCIPKLCCCKWTNLFQWVAFGLCFYLADRPEHNVPLNLLWSCSYIQIYYNTIMQVVLQIQSEALPKWATNVSMSQLNWLEHIWSSQSIYILCTIAWVSNNTDV